MPPRFAYWTIIFGGQPTAFRSATRDELLPTFKQIQAKHPDAQLRYFARGKLWYSDEEAHAALIRQRSEKRERVRPTGPKPRPGQWTRRDENRPPPALDGRPAPNVRKRDDTRRHGTGEWKPRGVNRPPSPGGWKPRSERRPPSTGGWKPRGETHPPKPGSWKSRPDGWRPGGEHKDPRARFKVPRDVKRARMAKKFGWKKKDEE